MIAAVCGTEGECFALVHSHAALIVSTCQNREIKFGDRRKREEVGMKLLLLPLPSGQEAEEKYVPRGHLKKKSFFEREACRQKRLFKTDCIYYLGGENVYHIYFSQYKNIKQSEHVKMR